ncbi:hypothetical protein [Kitasatospora sp. NPDC093102]|uniref:hypothetical protein n=1 Tax=Kitasatospora sp. NPDC093102 TaxID=3155069 RepID=UPI003429F5CA
MSSIGPAQRAADHDPDVFPPSSRDRLFDPLEADTLTFGIGRHFCPGAWLARLQMLIALHHLATRLSALRLATPVTAIEWRQGTWCVRQMPATLPGGRHPTRPGPLLAA